jgi:hypothetical protein
MNRLSGALHRVSNAWTILLATALYSGFLATVMPAQDADSRAYAGDWGAPDGHFFYTPDELYGQIRNWEAAGRADYIGFRLGLDIVWAFAYTAFLVTVTSVALRAALPAGDPRLCLNLLPMLPMLCDYAENALGIVLVANADTRLDLLAWLAAGVTAAKWASLASAHAVMLWALAAAARARWRRRTG